MDLTDQAILEALKHNGRASAAAIGKSVNLSVPAVLERMRKLTQSGIIQGYTVRINRQKTGQKLLAFVFVRLNGSSDTDAFRQQVAGYSCVLESHHITGGYDYLLKVCAEDTAALESFLTERLKASGVIAETNTMIVLATQKEEWYD